MANHEFLKGDTVVHPGRPEWGAGVIEQALQITHEGETAQRLVVRFSRKGRTTINTAFAPLEPKESVGGFRGADDEGAPTSRRSVSRKQARTVRPSHTPAMAVATSLAGAGGGPGDSDGEAPAGRRSSGQGWLSSLGDTEKKKPGQELSDLPDPMTDPFTSIGKRLEATLESFRYSPNPRSLMDWAVDQTGLTDPMSQYTRHELEQGYERFTVNRDRHLKQLIRQLKSKGDTETIHNIRRYLKVPAAMSALDKAVQG